MAFTEDTFLPMSSMANSNAPRHWTYTTPDAKAVVVAANYFNNAVGRGLQVQDAIWCVNDNDATPTFELVLVSAIDASGNVTVVSSTLALL